MSGPSQKRAVLVDRDPSLLARLSADFGQAGYECELMSSTMGLTPDLLELSSPSLLVLDAELPGIERSALLVIVRSLKARLRARVVITTAGDISSLKHLAADGYVQREALIHRGIRALGVSTEASDDQPLDVRAILDEVLGSFTAETQQQIAVRVDLFSKSNFYVDAVRTKVSGVFFATPVLLPVGTKVTVNLDLLGKSHWNLTGQVVWQRPHSSFGGRVATGVGIKFSDVSVEQNRMIDRFVELREPLVWGG